MILFRFQVRGVQLEKKEGFTIMHEINIQIVAKLFCDNDVKKMSLQNVLDSMITRRLSVMILERTSRRSLKYLFLKKLSIKSKTKLNLTKSQ